MERVAREDALRAHHFTFCTKPVIRLASRFSHATVICYVRFSSRKPDAWMPLALAVVFRLWIDFDLAAESATPCQASMRQCGQQPAIDSRF